MARITGVKSGLSAKHNSPVSSLHIGRERTLTGVRHIISVLLQECQNCPNIGGLSLSQYILMKKLSRAQIVEGFESIPIDTILLGSASTKQTKLTHKQREFAREIALGETKTGAYRKAYKLSLIHI